MTCIAPCPTYTFTVNQDGVTCNYLISPTGKSFTSSGGADSITVNAPSVCNWSAISNDPWITITSGSSGSGNGTIRYSVAANPDTSTRNGTITIEDKTFTVTQAGINCSYSISPPAQQFASAGGNGKVDVTAANNCRWDAIKSHDWITITSGASGSGNGTVNFSVAANGDPNPRAGTITVSDKTFTINQSGAAPARADLTITNTPSAQTATPGSRLTYTITLFNAGPDDASNVVVNVALPTTISFFSASGSGLLSAPAVGTSGPVSFSYPSLPPGGSDTIAIEVKVLAAAGTTLLNRATVTSSSSDPTSGNNSDQALTSVQDGGLVTLMWEQLPQTPENQTPPPANLQVRVGAASTGNNVSVESFDAPDLAPAAEACVLTGYNIYYGPGASVQPLPQNLLKVIRAGSLQTVVPTAPADSSYVVTAVYRCDGAPKESPPSDDVSIPRGGTVSNLRVGSKLKINGSGFTNSVEVFVDGVKFSKKAKVNGGGVVQKGPLSDGRSIGEVFVAGKTYLVTVRNINGGVASYSYTHR